jgi:tetratricopeptide (TPR) repeat protein
MVRIAVPVAVGLLLALPPLASAQEKNAHYWAQQGYKHAQKNEYKEAEECYKKSLALKPDDPFVYGNLTIVYLRTKRYPELVKAADDAIRLGIKFAGVYLNRAEGYRRLAEKEKDKTKQKELYQRAISDGEKVINYKDHNLKLSGPGEVAYAHAILSVCFRELGQEADAKKHYDRAIELDPKLKNQ